MKTKINIQSIINNAKTQGTYIPSGLTNDNYIVKEGTSNYVVRLPKESNIGLFDYHIEGQIIDKIEALDLDVPIVYFDSNSGIKVSQYIEDAVQFKIEHMNKVAPLLIKLHSSQNLIGKRYDIRKEYQKYYIGIRNPLFDLEQFEHYIHDAHELSDNWCLCHNDIVPGNLLFTKSRSYLIDYEYACDNDPIFDVMSFITENNINDKALRQSFYTAYFGSPLDKETSNKLFIFECALNVLWCTWAMRMHETDTSPVFKEIAITKYLNLLSAIRKKDSLDNEMHP